MEGSLVNLSLQIFTIKFSLIKAERPVSKQVKPPASFKGLVTEQKTVNCIIMGRDGDMATTDRTQYSNNVYPCAKEVTTQHHLALTPEITDLSDRQT